MKRKLTREMLDNLWKEVSVMSEDEKERKYTKWKL